MQDYYKELDLKLKFRSKNISKVVAKMWRAFYSLIRTENLEVDRAVWRCTTNGDSINVMAGDHNDDFMTGFKFSFTVCISGLTEALDKAAYATDAISEEEYFSQRDPITVEFYSWARAAILESWQTKGTQRSHQALCKGKFGIYTSPLWGVSPYELEQDIEDDVMHWLAGDKLVK